LGQLALPWAIAPEMVATAVTAQTARFVIKREAFIETISFGNE
jgi:hypothetical protein